MNTKTPGQYLKNFVQPIQKYLEDRDFNLVEFVDTPPRGGEHDYARMVFENHGRKVILRYYYNLAVFYGFSNYIVSHSEYMERLGHARWKEILFTNYPAEGIQEAINNLLHDWDLFFSEIFKDVKLIEVMAIEKERKI